MLSYLYKTQIAETFLDIRAFTLFSNQLTLCGYYRNSADPDQTPLYAASDQGLHCLRVYAKYSKSKTI